MIVRSVGFLAAIALAASCFPAFADDTQSSSTAERISESVKAAGESIKETTSEVIDKLTPERTSRQNRGESAWTVQWNPLSVALPLPSTGFQAGYLFNEAWSVEPEYQSGAFGVSLSVFDVGKIMETLYVLPFRWYPGNSFNLRFGVSYRTLSVEIGDSLLASVSREALHLNLVEISSYNLNFGVGNRWQFDNGITVGADWFDINVPIVTSMDEKISKYIDDSDDKEKVENVISLLRYFPPITFLKFQIGYAL